MSTSGSYDVIVVGAGLSGALIASTLADEGLQVVVLEANPNPGGTLRRQPGLALLGTPMLFTDAAARIGEEGARRLWELTRDNLMRLEILLDQHGIAAEKLGSLRLAATPDQSDAFRASAEKLQTYGFNVDLEDDNRYGDLVALTSHTDLVFRPLDLILSLLDHENIILEVDTEAHTTKQRADGTIAVWAHQSYLWADKVIFANGVHATRINPSLAEKLTSLCVHTVTLDNDAIHAQPLILDEGCICFLPAGERTYLSRWGTDEQESLRRLSLVAGQLSPDAPVRDRFTNWVATTSDLLPVVAAFDEEPNVFYTGGLGPLGLNLALVATDELAGLVLESQPPEVFGIERGPLSG